MAEYLNLNGKRIQSSLGKQITRDTAKRSDVYNLTIGRVTAVNYNIHTVDFVDLNTGASYSHSSSLKGKQSARLPVSFSGRNGNGDPYGDISPVNTGDLILVGFLNGNGTTPVVISIMGEDTVMESLSRDPNNATDNKAGSDQSTIGQQFVVYPDQTYRSKDGVGNEVLSFNGKTFLSMRSDNVKLQNDWGDNVEGPLYRNLDTSYFSDGNLIEPLNGLAPSILFKHQGIVDANDEPDTHETLLAVNQNGDARVSAMDIDEPYRGYLEVTHDGSIQLRFQPSSKQLNSNNGDEISLKLGSDGVHISVGGQEYSFGGDSLVVGTGADAVDLKKTTISNQQQQETFMESLETLKGGYQDNTSSINQLADKVAINASEVTSKNDTIFMLYGADATKVNLFSLNLATTKSSLKPEDGTLGIDANGITSSYIAVGSEDDYWVSAYDVPEGGTLSWAQYNGNNEFINYNYLTATTAGENLSSHVLTDKKASYVKVSYTAPTVIDEDGKTSTAIPLVKFAKVPYLTTWTPAPSDILSNSDILALAIAKTQSYQTSIEAEIETMESAITGLNATLNDFVSGAVTSAQLSTLKSAISGLESNYSNLFQEATRVGVDTSAIAKAYNDLNSYLATVSSTRVYDADKMTEIINSYKDAFTSVANASKEQYNILSTNLNGSLSTLTGATKAGSVNYALLTGTPVSVTTGGVLYDLSQNIADLKGTASLAFDYTLSKLEQIIIGDSNGKNSYKWTPKELTGSFFYTFDNWQNLSPTVSLKIVMPTNTKIDVTKLILSYGNSETSWQAAPEDLASYVNNKFSEFKVTPDMITSEVYNSITESTLGSTKYQEDFSKMTQTATGFETLISHIGSDGSTLKTYTDGKINGLSDVYATQASLTATSTKLNSTFTAGLTDLEGNIASKYATTSSLTQTADKINLSVSSINSDISDINTSLANKVDSDKIISAINLSPDGVSIQGSKIKITGDTYIEKGALTADYITTGILSSKDKQNFWNLDSGLLEASLYSFNSHVESDTFISDSIISSVFQSVLFYSQLVGNKGKSVSISSSGVLFGEATWDATAKKWQTPKNGNSAILSVSTGSDGGITSLIMRAPELSLYSSSTASSIGASSMINITKSETSILGPSTFNALSSFVYGLRTDEIKAMYGDDGYGITISRKNIGGANIAGIKIFNSACSGGICFGDDGSVWVGENYAWKRVSGLQGG